MTLYRKQGGRPQGLPFRDLDHVGQVWTDLANNPDGLVACGWVEAPPQPEFDAGTHRVFWDDGSEQWIVEELPPPPPPPPPAPPTIPDGPTLADWRVGLRLWPRPDGQPGGRLQEVLDRVANLKAQGHPMALVIQERLEYSNHVMRDNLMALREVMGFSAAEVDESLWRAQRVTMGDLSGQWPVG